MKIVFLDAATVGEDIDLSPIETFGKLTVYDTTAPSQCAARIADAEIVITNKVVLDAKLLAQVPKLKLICVAATGMNNIDLEAAKARGIVVKNVKGYSTRSVAQHTFAMLFYLLEKMAYYDRYVKEGAWSQSPIFTHIAKPFFELHGKAWGIIGMGAIGQEVAKLATAFGAEVSYHSTSGVNLRHAYPHKSLEFILKDSDIVSIHAPLNEKTYDLLNEFNLPYLKEKAILLNLGRGGIVNETDLAFELDRREIYAGLDVLAHEPIEESNPLNFITHKERLLITPHIAWTSIEARKRLIEAIAKNIHSFVE